LVVGVDAGGTRTRALAATAAEGRVVGEGTGGPGNALSVPPARLAAHLAEAVGQAVPERSRAQVVAVAAGFAGATTAVADDPGRRIALAALADALARIGVPAGPLDVRSDIEAAFASAPGAPADGLALVAGTGAVAVRITGRRCTATADGGGWLLGDEGSGFWIGRAAARAALRAADGRGGPTVLAGTVGQELGAPREVLPPEGFPPGEPPPGGGAPRWSRADREVYRARLLPVVMAQAPVHLARLAPLVVRAAGAGDAVAVRILDDAVEHLVCAVRALEPRPGERVVVTGGLLGPDGPLTARLTSRLQDLRLAVDPVAGGCRGAVELARLAVGRGRGAA
jgi:N-acetylglucosamine kinase-like BadF-type ATPase